MTAQATEKLIYKDQKLNLCSNPLTRYLETIRNNLKFVAHSSSNWRGYIGTWRIEDHRLYLSKLNGTVQEAHNEREIDLTYLFPDYPDGVFAHLYTGELRCVQGRLINYSHGGYGSIYETDLFLRVERGVVLDERIVLNGKAPADARQGYVLGASTTFGSEDRS